MFRHRLTGFCLVLLASLLMFTPLKAQDIYAAGPTYPALFYYKWFQEYQAQTGVHVNYETIGSNGDLTAHPIDFRLGDAPMSEDEMRISSGALNLPMAAHAVVIVYNLPGITAKLRLTGPIIADIYLGKITRWNDPQIVKINPGTALPDLAVNPVHQSNGNGTTYILTTYLSAVSPLWKSTVSAGTSVRWPVGLGGKQCAGVAHIVLQTPGSIGYMELSNIAANPVPFAAIQNAKGNFVVPSLESAELAASAVTLPRDMRGSIVNSPAPLGYPLVGYTYLFVYTHPANPQVKDFITWILTKGQRDTAIFGYASLPAHVQKQALAAVAGTN